ncbi:MAG: reverse transcriptase-like protein [Chloroflexia bacterium]|nr:reverse transcriptase-like protein [Chloroflexia bacterium]
MNDQGAVRGKPLATRVAERRLLDRDQLLALVEELHALVIHQRQTVDRQGAAIARMQAGDNTGAAPSPPPVAPPARKTARPVAGSDFTIVFDGGAIGNPGKGYGSYQIVDSGGVVSEGSPRYDGTITNNQAEFLTLIRALEDLKARQAAAATRTTVAIRGDSQLVLNTITGKWKARHAGLIPLHRQVVLLLHEFGKTDIQWQPRAKSVAILGH